MAITYNKQMVTKDRRVMPTGPRDRQRKQQMESQLVSDHSELINELRNQVSTLQEKLATKPSSGGWTDEQVNNEIEKALKAETAEIKAKIEIEKSKRKSLEEELSRMDERVKERNDIITTYKNEIEKLKIRLEDKDKKIKELESRPVQVGIDNNVTALLAEANKKIEALSLQVAAVGTTDQTTIVSDRPQMETVFVDPIEKESKVEKHFEVEVEDVTINKKEEMDGKVNKLKNLLGKLPTRR